eukprot:gene10330-11403_t
MMTQNKNPSRRNIFSSQVLGKRKLQVTADEGGGKKKFIKKDVRSVLKRTGTDDLLSFTFEKAISADDCSSVIDFFDNQFINHSSYTSTMVRLKSMGLAVSHTYFNKKLDQLGVMHDADVTRLMEIEKRKLQAAFPVPECTPIAETVTDGNSSLSEASKAIHAQRMALVEDIKPLDLEFDFTMPALRKCAPSYLDASETDSKGFKLCFDNVDTHVEVHDMTEENQNIDLHECAMALFQRELTMKLSAWLLCREVCKSLIMQIFCSAKMTTCCNARIILCWQKE